MIGVNLSEQCLKKISFSFFVLFLKEDKNVACLTFASGLFGLCSKLLVIKMASWLILLMLDSVIFFSLHHRISKV